MAIKIISAKHRGLDGVLISVEVDIMKGLPTFNIIGYISKLLKLAYTHNYIKGKSAIKAIVREKIYTYKNLSEKAHRTAHGMKKVAKESEISLSECSRPIYKLEWWKFYSAWVIWIG